MRAPNLMCCGRLLLVVAGLFDLVASQLVSTYGRDDRHRMDPNQLLNGFFPAWAFVMLALAGKRNMSWLSSDTLTG